MIEARCSICRVLFCPNRFNFLKIKEIFIENEQDEKKIGRTVQLIYYLIIYIGHIVQFLSFCFSVIGRIGNTNYQSN